jgi:ubiquinone/menaquinone biosynthesis C-methylase UbiE
MDTISNWLDALRCPDCHGSIAPAGRGTDVLSCAGCSREFSASRGIWNFLPVAVAKREEKDKEKQGWTQKTEEGRKAGWDPGEDHFLSLPNHPHPYYQAAAWYLRIVLAYGSPWKGKKVLELGAAECWGTRGFAEAGCQAAALDYDPTRMLKGQILLDHLPITFSRFTGDAESLPFADNSLDGIFCCSVLHHFFDLPKAIQEISRTLRPGGRFFGIHEAFHPPYYSKKKILEMSADTLPNIEVGINESSYPLRYYRNAFKRAGLKFEVLHPHWDVKENGAVITVAPGAALYNNPSYVPEMFSGRVARRDIPGYLSRLILRSGIWRLAAHPYIFPLLRFHILNWTTKDKVIVAQKAGTSH